MVQTCCSDDEIYFIKLVLFVFRPPTGKQKIINLCVLCAFAVNKYISYNMLPEKIPQAHLNF
jgi:hypothetical protein